MNTFKLKISSPDGDIYNGDVIKISLRGTEGELAIMSGHIPFATYVVPCEVKLDIDENTIKSAKIDGGILNVSSDSAILLSGTFEWIN